MRRRRERDLQDYRVDERARQRACRHRRKSTEAAGSDAQSRACMDILAVVADGYDTLRGQPV